MHLGKFMHPRNRYKKIPDFKHLAVLYPEFRKVALTDLSGKVRLNFKDEESLRVLTKVLLKHDFSLEVEIPTTNLIPALSLRLNYVLWIEDLLIHAGITNIKSVHGIDIGTGASCIYPLLFAKLYGCKMTASEIDLDSIKSANENVNRNNLQNLIKVVSVPKETILTRLLEDDANYSFVMSNPPFFKNERDLEKQEKRLPPRNASSGNESELIVEGGEVAFVTRLIADSIKIKEKVKVYTTMIGVKANFISLKSQLKNQNVDNVTWTEFCQGFTKRWGLAWSFQPKSILNLSTAPSIRMKADGLERKRKEESQFHIIFPPHDGLISLEEVVAALKACFGELNINMKEICFEEREDPYWACKLIANEDSWSQARRKRRLHLQPKSTPKKFRVCESENQSSSECIIFPQKKENCLSDKSIEPFLVFSLVLYSMQTDNEKSEQSDSQFNISLKFKTGSGGKYSLETFRQFLVNKLNVRKYFEKQFKNKRKL